MDDARVHDEIVRWEFDNSDFEKKAAQTLTTLQRLEKALHINNVIDIAKGIKLDHLANDVDKVAQKFTAFGIMGKKVLENLADRAQKTGEQFVKSLTIKDAEEGFKKYEEQVGSVQTLMNTTGLTAKEIQKYVDKFAIYSDETSYSLDQMVRAFSQMTTVADLSGTAADKAAELKKIQDMIIGIANASAFAGKTGQEFSRTIYNLTQSYQTGSLKLMDWRSLQMAGTASKQLMEEMIKAGEDLYKQSKGKNGFKEGTVTVQNFNDVLKKGVITTEVMENAFGKFGELAVAAAEGVQSGEYQTFADAVDALGDSFSELSKKATESAWSAKTFKEAFFSIHDAVSTQWAKTYQYIIGDYEEARELWSSVAEVLFDVFGQAGIQRNKLLKEWSENNGRYFLISSLENLLNGIASFIVPIRDAWASVFKPFTSRELTLLTMRLSVFTHKLFLSGESQAKLRSITVDFAKALKTLLGVLKEIVRPVTTILGPVDQLWNKILIGVKIISALTNAVGNMISQSETAIKVLRVLLAVFVFRKKIAGSISMVLGLSKAILSLIGIIRLVGVALGAVAAYSGVKWLMNWFTNGKGAQGINKVKTEFEKFRNTLNSLNSWKLEDYINALKNFATFAKNGLLKGLGDIGNRIKQIDWRSMFSPKIVAGVDNIIEKVNRLKQLIGAFKESIEAGAVKISSLKTLFDLGYSGFANTFKNLVQVGIRIRDFGDIAKNGFAVARDAVKNFFTKDTLTGFSPFENTLSRIKDTFSSKEGFLRSLELAKNNLKNLGSIAVAPWKLSSDKLGELKEQLKGLPGLILSGTSNFKGFLDNLKNPETIKAFGHSLKEAFSSISEKAIGGLDKLTDGKFTTALARVSDGFAKVKSAAENIRSVGIERFNFALAKLRSLVDTGKGGIKQGIGQIKSFIETFDTKLGAIGPKIFGIADNLRGKLPQIIKPLFTLMDTFKGGKYSRIINSLKTIFTTLQSSISKIGGSGLKQFTDSLRSMFETFRSGAPFTKTLDKLKESISAFLGIFKNIGPKMSAPVRSMSGQTNIALEVLGQFKERFKLIIDGITAVTRKINEILPPGLAGNIIKLVSVVGQLVIMNKIAKILKSSLFDITTAAKSGVETLSTITSPVKALSNGIAKIFAPFESIAAGITNIATTLGTAISTFTTSFSKKVKAEAFNARAEGLLKLAGAVAVLAGAMWIIAQIPIDGHQLLYAAGAIAVLMVALSAFALVFDKMGKSWAKDMSTVQNATDRVTAALAYIGKSGMIISLAAALLAVAGAVRMLMGPIKELSEMSWTEFANGAGKVALVMTGLTVAVGVLGHAVKGAAPGLIAAGILMLGFNLILSKMLSTMLVFGEIFTGPNAKKAIAGAVGVGITLAATTAAIYAIGSVLSKFTAGAKILGGKANPAGKALVATGVLLVSITVFLNQLANVIKKYKDLKVRFRDVGVVFAAIAGTLLGIAGYVKVLQLAKLTDDVNKVGLMLVGFAGALALVAAALHLFSNLDTQGVGRALPAIALSIAGIIGVIAILGKVSKGISLGSGVALLGLAALIMTLSTSLMLLTLVDYAKLEMASTSLSKVILSLGVTLALASSFGAKAGAIMAFTFVLKELTSSLVVLSFIDFAKLESAANNLSKVLLSLSITMLMSGSMAGTGILQWIGIIGTIAALVGALLVLQGLDMAKLQKTSTILGALEVVSALMVGITALLPPGGGLNALASLAGAALVIGALTGLLYIAGQIPDPEKAAGLLNSCTVFLGMVAVVIGGLGQLNPLVGVKAAVALIAFLGILGAAIGAAVYALGSLAGSDNEQIQAGMENLERGFTKIGEFIGDIAGGFITGLVDKAGGSLDKIQEFLEAAKSLKDAISPEESAGISSALGIAKDILSLEIPNDGGLAGLIFGNNNIGDFGVDIQVFGNGLRMFADSISGITANEQEIQNAITMAKGLADLAHAIPETDHESLKAAIFGVKDLGEFAAQLAGGTENVSGATRSFGEAAQSNRGLGASIRMFVDSVKDIPDDAWDAADKAIKASEAIAKFAQYVPKSKGFVQKITGVHNLADFALSLAGDGTDGNPGFATSLKQLITTMQSVGDPSQTVANIVATKPLLDFFRDNTSLWDAFKTAEIKEANSNSLVEAVQALTAYAHELAFLQQYDYLDASKLSNITAAVMAAAPMVEFFNDNSGIWNSVEALVAHVTGTEGDNPLVKAAEGIKEYAHSLALLQFYDYLDAGKLTNISTSLEASAGILDFYNKNTSIFDSAFAAVRRWLDNGKNPLANAIDALIPYAKSLKTYSEEISGITNMTQIVTSTYAFGAFADAVNTLFGAQNKTELNSFGYITNFSESLGALGTALADYATNFGGLDISSATQNTNEVIETLKQMMSISPETSDGFISAVAKLGQVGLDEFYAKFENATDHLNSSISAFIGEAVSILSRKPNQDRMKTGAINLYNGFLEGQKQKLDEARSALEKFVQDLPNAITVDDEVMRNIGLKITSGISEGIQLGKDGAVKSAKTAVHEIMTAVGDGIGDDYDDPPQTDKSLFGQWTGEKVMNSFGAALTAGKEMVGNAVNGVASWFQNTFSNQFGEGSGLLANIGGIATNLWGTIEDKFSSGFQQLTGQNLSDILSGAFAVDENGNNGIGRIFELGKTWYKKLLGEEEKAVEQGKKTAADGAADVGKTTKGAASKAVKDAKDAGKEILTEEDAFWVALLAKKRAGANAAEYQDMKVKDFEKKMLEEVNKLVDDYKEKLNSTTDDILGMIGLFDAVEEKVEETEETFGDLFKGISDNTSKLEGNINDLFKRVDAVTKSDEVPVSGDLLMANLQDQIDKYTEYYDIQDNLAKRINNNKLKKTLKDMTIDSIQELKALNEMSDDELNKYVDLFNKRVEVAARGKVKKEAEESPTAELLTKNLEDQVEKYKDYKEVITNLNARVTSSKLKETLNGMSIDNIEQLKVIESMTDEELSHYVALFEEKYSLSRSTAEVKLEETKKTTEDKLDELLETTGLKLDDFLEQFDGTLGSLTDLIEKHLTGGALPNAVGHMAQELINVLLGVFNNAQMSTEEKIAEIQKQIENAAALGVDLTDQYSQGIVAILANTEMTADDKLQAILTMMTNSQVSLAQTSKNLAETTKSTIAKILSDAEAAKLVKSLIGTLNDGVSSAQDKIDKFKVAIQQAGENNVQISEVFRARISEILSNTTLDADTQIQRLLEILNEATASYQNWAIQDMGLLSADLVNMSKLAQSNLNTAASGQHETIKQKLRETTDASEEEIDTMAESIESSLDNMTSSAISSQEAFSSTVQDIVKSHCDATVQEAQAAADALEDVFAQMRKAKQMAARYEEDDDDDDDSDSRDPIGMWESATGKTLTDAQKEFARNGGAIVGGGGSQVIKDGRYWDSKSHMSYDIGSGAAHDALEGFRDTISDGLSSMHDSGESAAESFSDGFTGPGGLDEHSPSKKMMEFARFALLGWASGIDQYSHLVSESGQSSADSYVNVFNEAMRNIDMPEDISPVITPIIDISRAQASMDALDNFFSTEKSYSMASDIKRATDLAQKAKAIQEKPAPQPAPQPTTMNFTQNNYSPKALSKLDIYRQTKNQFAQMKGALA